MDRIPATGKTVTVCSIGSTDPLGAAGLTMDVRVYARLALGGATVVTAVTAQNARHVTSVQALPRRILRRQLEAVWEQVRPDAICIGLIAGAAAVREVRRFLQAQRSLPPMVIDPVLAASSGYRFASPDSLRELRRLLRLATLVMPNADEAALLSGLAVHTPAQAHEAARRLAEEHGCAVLVTGGHLRGRRCVDTLVASGRTWRWAAPRLPGRVRGCGGILAAAVAAGLARGQPLTAAIAQARRIVRAARRRARTLGSGTPQVV